MKQTLLFCTIVVTVFSIPRVAISQMEFIGPGQKAVMGILDFAGTNNAYNYGAEALFTNDARVGVGLLFGSGSSDGTTVTSLGVEGTVSVLRPSSDFPFGFEAMASCALTHSTVASGISPWLA